MERVRILHTPTNTANHPFSLSRAERRLGFDSDVVDFRPAEHMQFPADRVYDLSGRPFYVHAARRGAFLAHAIRRYDVFHFNWGQPLFPVRIRGRVLNELGLLKRLGKTVIVTFQGSDVRPTEDWYDRWRGPNAEAMLRHADRAFYLNPDLAPYLPGARFLPYANVDVAALTPAPILPRAEAVIAHAPSNRAVKGTDAVIAAVDALREEGAAVRLDLIEDTPHEQALARLAAADIVVDQLRLGWYGGVAVESMALGRPVVARIDESANPFGDRLPIVRADAGSLIDRLRELVGDIERRRSLGEASRAFVVAEHDPVAIARRVLDGLVPVP